MDNNLVSYIVYANSPAAISLFNKITSNPERSFKSNMYSLQYFPKDKKIYMWYTNHGFNTNQHAFDFDRLVSYSWN